MGQTETCFFKNFYLNNQCLTSLATQMVLSPRFVFLKQNLTNFKFTFRGHCNHRCISDKATGVQRGSRQNKEQKPSNIPGVKAVDAPERISKNAVRSVWEQAIKWSCGIKYSYLHAQSRCTCILCIFKYFSCAASRTNGTAQSHWQLSRVWRGSINNLLSPPLNSRANTMATSSSISSETSLATSFSNDDGFISGTE